jgi:hypothetical protein
MEPGRRCYRLVGDVLVQRTVGEALPAVERNKAGLDGLLATLRAQLEARQRALQEFQDRRGDGGGGLGCACACLCVHLPLCAEQCACVRVCLCACVCGAPFTSTVAAA